MSLVSFVVPVHGTEAFLPACIESVLAQTDPRFELILVDDGSPDGCPAICDTYAARDDRVRVIHQENAGVVVARNRGVEASRGDYVCFVDSDDLVAEGLVGAMRKVALSCPEAPDVVLFGHRVMQADGVVENPPSLPVGLYDRRRLERVVLPVMVSDPTRPWWTPGVPLYLWGKAYHRDYLLGHLFEDASITLGEDVAMCLDCLAHAQSLFVSGEILYTYRRTNAASVSRAYRGDLVGQFARTFAFIRGHVGGEAVIDRQLDDYFCYRILRAVYIEVEHGHATREAARHLAREFGRTRILDFVNGSGTPAWMRAVLWLLRRSRFESALVFLKAAGALRRGMLGLGRALPGRIRDAGPS